MGTTSHNKPIVRDGLVFCIDPANKVSWSGPDSSTVNDLIGTNNGTIYNDTSGSYGDNSSFNFDGTDSYIDAGSSVGVIGTSDYSFSSWVKTSQTSGTQTILGTRNYNTNGWVIQIELNIIMFYNVFTPSNRIQTTTNLTNGNWYNLVVVRGGTTSTNKIYVNGVSQSLTYNNENGTNPQSSNNLLIGAGYNNGGTLYRFFDGNMGPTMIYSKKLSASEVAQNYNALKNRFI